jgi:hypothetical protein
VGVTAQVGAGLYEGVCALALGEYGLHFLRRFVCDLTVIGFHVVSLPFKVKFIFFLEVGILYHATGVLIL